MESEQPNPQQLVNAKAAAKSHAEEASPYFTDNSATDEASKAIFTTERELVNKNEGAQPAQDNTVSSITQDAQALTLEEHNPTTAGEKEVPSDSAASTSVMDEGEKQLRQLLLASYKREGILLRQLAKVEQDVRNRFLLFNESAERLAKGLEWFGDDIETLSVSAQNLATLASMMKQSPEQSQMFER